jgi:hypothetical protein
VGGGEGLLGWGYGAALASVAGCGGRAPEAMPQRSVRYTEPSTSQYTDMYTATNVKPYLPVCQGPWMNARTARHVM